MKMPMQRLAECRMVLRWALKRPSSDCRYQPAVTLNDLGEGTQTSLWPGWGSAVPSVTVQETRLSLYLESRFYLLEKHKGWQERVWVHLLIKGINQIDLIGYDLRQVSLGLSIADVPGSSSAFINTLTIVNPYVNGNTPFWKTILWDKVVSGLWF